MGKLDSSAGWSTLPDKVIDELPVALERDRFSLKILGWFDEGRSDEPVAHAIRTPDLDGDSEHLVLKFLFKRDREERLDNIERTFGRAKAFQNHLAVVCHRPHLRIGDWRGVFLRVAGGGLDSATSLTRLFTEPDFHEYCGKIVRSTVHEWNKGTIRADHTVSFAEALGTVLTRRRALVESWAARMGVPVDGSPDPAPVEGWPDAPVNPFALVSGEYGRWQWPDLLVGNAHGDLSGRNILLPQDDGIDADRFVLIDYDRSSANAPLARDPMHLLVSLVLDHFGLIGNDVRAETARVIVDPNDPDTNGVDDRFRRLSRELHEGGSRLTSLSLRDQWRRQCRLFLVGAGLMHLGRTMHMKEDYREEAKKWCFHVAALAAAKLVGSIPSTSTGGTAAPSRTATRRRVGPDGLVDREDKTRQLRQLLTGDTSGVVFLRGKRGIGKTRLLRAVLDGLGADRARVRVHRYEATPAVQVDARTVIEAIAGVNGSEHTGRGSSPLLERVLGDLGDERVVIVIDSAGNLVDPATRTLREPELDEVFEMLATRRGHRVLVLLVVEHEAVARHDGIWDGRHEPILLGELHSVDYLEFLRTLGQDERWDVDRLADPDRESLYGSLQGNPRLGEVARAVVTLGEDHDLPGLVGRLRSQEPRNARSELNRILLTSLERRHKEVLEALAVLATSVPAPAVAALLAHDSSETVKHVLSALVRARIVHRTEDDQYFIAEPEARVIDEAWHNKHLDPGPYSRAALQLSHLAFAASRETERHRLKIAALRAFLKAGKHAAAFGLVKNLDAELRERNRRHVLLDHCQKLAGKLEEPYDEMWNREILGQIYTTAGEFPAAQAEYEEALKIAQDNGFAQAAVQIKGNLAAMYWQLNEVGFALGNFEFIRDQSQAPEDRTTLMAALEGIADCHRRYGDYTQAIQNARDAFDQYARLDFPVSPEERRIAQVRSLAVALKLARWHGESDRRAEAEEWLEAAHRMWVERGDDAPPAAYLDTRAVLMLDRGDRTSAKAVAEQAVARALLEDNREVLMEARTTLAFTNLGDNRLARAERDVQSAMLHRKPGRALVVLALAGIVARRTGKAASADRLFRTLLDEATRRIESNSLDFAAFDFKGLAHCALHLDARDDLAPAVEAFNSARGITSSAPVLRDRLRFLLDQLDRRGTVLGGVLNVP